MILGFPDWLFFIFVALGVSMSGFVTLLVIYYLIPWNGKQLLRARLKKQGLLAIFGKATLRLVRVKSIAPGWVETEEGKKFIWPIPPKEKDKSWNPVRDVISKVERIDNIPVLAVYEAEALATNGESLVSLEAFVKGHQNESEIEAEVPVELGNPGIKLKRKFNVYIPVTPKVLAETLRSMVSTEHIDVFEQMVIEAERKRRGLSEKWTTIKILGIISAVVILYLIIVLLAPGAIG